LLEALEKVDTLVVDKTGTLTEGRPKLTEAVPIAPFTEDDLLRYAASIEQNSEHPLAVPSSSEQRIGTSPSRPWRSSTQ
jgi:Cu+-exporting ATPase